MTDRYEVVRYATDQWYEDGSRVVINGGGTYEELYDAVVEATARECLEMEGGDRSWTVAYVGTEGVSPEESELPDGVDPVDVCEYLVEELGIDPTSAYFLTGLEE